MRAVIFLLRRSSRTSWRAWLALALLVGLVGGVVLTAAAGARRTDTAYTRLERSINAPDVLISPNGTGLTGYSNALRRLPNVRDVAKVVLLNTGFEGGAGAGYVGGAGPKQSVAFVRIGHHDLTDLNLAAGFDDHMAITMDRPKLLEGRLFDPSRPDEALVDFQLASQYQLHPGSRFELVGLSPVMPPASNRLGAYRVQRWVMRVSGVAVFDSRIVPITTADSKPYVVLTPTFARRLNPSYVGADGAFLRLRTGSDMATVRNQVELLAAQFPDAGGSVFFSNLDDHQGAVTRAIRPDALALGIIAAVLGLIGLVVIGQLLVRQIWLDAPQVPRLRAVGASHRDLFVLAMLRVGTAALVGAVLAAMVAVLASPLTPIDPARLAEPDPGFEVNLAVVLIGLVTIPVLLVLVAAPSAWRTTTSAGEPLFAPPPRASRVIPLSAPVTAALGMRMALQPGQGRMTAPVRSALVGLTVSLAALTAVLVFGASLDRLLGTPTRYGQHWNLAMESFGALPEYDVAPIAASIRGVDAYSGGAFGQLSIKGQVVPAVGIDRIRGDAFPTLLEGRPPATPREIALGARTMRELHLRVGDNVAIGLRGSTRRVRVVGEVILPGLSRGSFNPTDLGDGAATVASVFAPPASIGSGPGYNLVFLGLHPGVDVDNAAKVLTTALIARGCPGPSSCPVTTQQRPGDIGNYSRIRTAPVILALVVSVLALATLTHVLITSIRRRRRDLAVLRSLGFTAGQVSSTVAWQSSVLAAVAVVIGIPVGVALGRWAWVAFADSIGVAGDIDLPILVVLLILPAVFLVANVVAVLPGWTARRLQPSAILRGE